MPSDTTLQVRDLRASHGAGLTLHGINLAVAGGEAVAVVGRNGVGKTTLVESIFQMGPRTSGSVSFGTHRLDQMKTQQMMRLGIALVPQGRRLFASLSVVEHLQLAQRMAGQSNLNLAYDMFPILRERAKYPATSLSGGEQSMLSIARALVTNPKLVVMDEPTEGLAPLLVHQVRDALIAMKERGVQILLIEQNLRVAMAVSDRLLVMDRGEITAEFDTASIDNLARVRQLIVMGSG